MTNIRIKYLHCIVLAAMAMVCGNPDSLSAQSAYVTPWFQFDVPAGWVQVDTGNTLPSVVGPNYSGFQPKVDVFFGTSAETLSDVARVKKATFDDVARGHRVISQRFFRTRNGYSAHEYYIEYRGSRFRYLDGIVVFEGENYKLSVWGFIPGTDEGAVSDGQILEMFNSARPVIMGPAITSHPQAQEVEDGQTLSLSISVASEATYTTEWYRNGIPLGIEGNTLSVDEFQQSFVGDYYAIAKNFAGEARSSTVAVTWVSSLQPPSFTTHPVSQSVADGGTLVLSVAVRSEGPYTLEWFKDGAAVGATTATLSVSPFAAADAGQYWVVAKNGAGEVRSDIAEANSGGTLVARVDTAAPLINLVGPTSLLHEAATPFADPGASALDDFDGSASVKVDGAVDVGRLGSYELRYTAVDSSGNEASPKTRTVRVIDTTPPFIQLVGSSELTIQTGSTFVDPGATAVDSFEGELSVSVSGAVNTAVQGDYTLKYSAQDSSENQGIPVSRRVMVSESAPASEVSRIVTASSDQAEKEVGDSVQFVARLLVPSESAFFQWFKGDKPLAGENSSILSIDNLTMDDSGSYKVSVVSGSEVGLSTPVALLVRNAKRVSGYSVIVQKPFLVEIKVTTSVSQVYQLQASSDLSDWQNDGPRFIGTGEDVRLIRDKGLPGRFWRVEISGEKTSQLPEPPLPDNSAKTLTIEDIGLELVPIPAGTFTMGSPNDEVDRRTAEGPQTKVTLTQDFWLGKTEVTQKQWEAIMGYNPSRFKGENLPVEKVTWNVVMEFCRKLTERERAAGRLDEGHEYTLPTEAQWEYAFRAGTTTRFSFGDDPEYSQLGDYGWYRGNSSGLTHDVGGKLANPWGLYDMHGNVLEWCQDRLGNYSGGSEVDPEGPAQGSNRVPRGGHWNSDPRGCRSANRDWAKAYYTNEKFGFRVALVAVP